MLVGSSLLFFIIVTSTASPEISEYLKPVSGRRDVNFTLETVFEINKNEAADVRVLKNAEKLLNKMKKNFLRYNGKQEPNDSEADVFNNITFSGFIEKVIQVLNKYEDLDLNEFFTITNDEIKKYHYRGCKFHELTEDFELRKYVSHLLDENKDKSTDDIRKILNTMSKTLSDKNLELYKREFIDAINDLYKVDYVDNFKKFLINIEDYRQKARKNMDLVKIVRSGVRSIMFDHYTDLSDQERSQFKSKLGDFFNYYKGLSTAVMQMHTDKNKLMRYKTIKRIVTDRIRKPYKKRRMTLIPQTFKQMYIEKNLDLKYNPDANYDNFTTTITIIKGKNKDNPSNFQAKKQTRNKIPQKTLNMHSSDTDNKIYESHWSTPSNKPVIEVITMRPYISKRVMTSQKLRYEIHFKTQDIGFKGPKLHLKKPEFQIKLPGAGKHKVHISKPNGPPEMFAPMFRHNNLMYLSGKIETETEASKKTREKHKNLSIKARKKYNKSSRVDRATSNETFLLPSRKSFDNASVLTRLSYLENELQIAKTQIKNDSEIIRDLSNIMRASQKTINSLNPNNSESLVTVNDNGQRDNKGKKDVVIDLKINLEDFKKLINLKSNQDEIFQKLNLEKNDNIYTNRAEKSIVRKFDFDQTEYNNSKKNNFDSKENEDQKGRNENTINKDKEKELNSIKPRSHLDLKYSTKPQRGYLSDGDTYERVEERIYDSDSNKRQTYKSDKDKVVKWVNYEDVTKQPKKNMVFYTDGREHINKNIEDNDRKYDSYSTLKNYRENKVGGTDHYILSSTNKPRQDEGIKNGVPMMPVPNNDLDRRYITTTIKRRYYPGSREHRKQKEIENYSDKANDNLSHEYNSVKNRHKTTDFALDKYKKNSEDENHFKFNTNKRYVTFNPDSHQYTKDGERNNKNSYETNINQKRTFVTHVNEQSHRFEEEHSRLRSVTQESDKAFKDVTTKSRLVTQMTTKSQRDEELEKGIENDNANFVRTAVHPEMKVHHTRYVMSKLEAESPKSKEVALITAVITISPLSSSRRKGPGKRTF